MACTQVRAEEKIGRTIEVGASLGHSRHSGYLSEKESTGAYDLSFRISSTVARGYFEIFVFGTRTDAKTQFGFSQSQEISIAGAGIGPVVQVACVDDWKFNLGVGFAKISAHGDDPVKNEKNFGTFYYLGAVQYQLTPEWGLFLQSRWMDVKQTNSGDEAFFTLWNNTLGAAYKF